jgi:hypothetical protein
MANLLEQPLRPRGRLDHIVELELRLDEAVDPVGGTDDPPAQITLGIQAKERLADRRRCFLGELRRDADHVVGHLANGDEQLKPGAGHPEV